MSSAIETKEELFAVMEQIAAEREAARPIVEKLVASGQQVEDIEIPEEWRTAGMVMELADFGYSRNESNPLQSLSFAHLALAIATSLEVRAYSPPLPSYLEGRAWKELGYAHRALNSYDASVSAYQASEQTFSHQSALVYQEAAATFARAAVLFLAKRDDEALLVNAAAREVFRSMDDVRRDAMCDVVDAMVTQRRAQLDVAREKYEKALKRLRDSDDLHTIGVIYNNIARAYLDLGRTSDAVTALKHAREIFTDLEMPSAVNRADWGLAMVLLDTGSHTKALPILSRLRDDYLHRHMPEDAGEVGLCMVDAYVATNQLEAARTLTSQVLKEFVEARLNTEAISALAYLRDLLHTNGDLRAAVRRVRSHVEKLRSEPARLFVPIDENE